MTSNKPTGNAATVVPAPKEEKAAVSGNATPTPEVKGNKKTQPPTKEEKEKADTTPAPALTIETALIKMRNLQKLSRERDLLNAHILKVNDIPTSDFNRLDVSFNIQFSGDNYAITNPKLISDVKEFLMDKLNTKKSEIEAELLSAY